MDERVLTVAVATAPGEGEVRLCLRAERGRIAVVRVENRRRLDLLAALRGRMPAELPGLLARLFPICGSAHALACAAALAAAGAPVRAWPAARDHLRAELAIAHAWRHAIDWPDALGRAPEPLRLRPLYAAATRVRAAATQAAPEHRHAALGHLADCLQQLLFAGDVPDSDAALCDFVRADRGIVGALFARLRASPLAIASEPPGRLLARPDARWFAARLGTDSGFAAHPSWDGVPAEVGAWADANDETRTCFAEFGALGARLLAMLAEARALLAELRCALSAPDIADDACQDRAGCGCAVLPTARGPLAYWLRVDGSRVVDLRAVAPSEWALHPRGPLPAWLRGLPLHAALADARLALAACDPCAQVRVVIEGDAHA